MDPFTDILGVTEDLKGFGAQWGVAGGWAIDLWLDRQTRAHADVEVAVLRKDQLLLQQHLRQWRFDVVLPRTGGKIRPWTRNEKLELPHHELQGQDERRRLEVLLNESDASDWIFRRAPSIKKPLVLAFLMTKTGIPVLAPEIVLLYKAITPAAKDEHDFAQTAATLAEEQRDWLKHALNSAYPNHPWARRLS